MAKSTTTSPVFIPIRCNPVSKTSASERPVSISSLLSTRVSTRSRSAFGVAHFSFPISRRHEICASVMPGISLSIARAEASPIFASLSSTRLARSGSGASRACMIPRRSFRFEIRKVKFVTPIASIARSPISATSRSASIGRVAEPMMSTSHWRNCRKRPSWGRSPRKQDWAWYRLNGKVSSF